MGIILEGPGIRPEKSETGSRTSGLKTQQISLMEKPSRLKEAGLHCGFFFLRTLSGIIGVIRCFIEEPVGTGERALVKAQMRLLSFTFKQSC